MTKKIPARLKSRRNGGVVIVIVILMIVIAILTSMGQTVSRENKELREANKVIVTPKKENSPTQKATSKITIPDKNNPSIKYEYYVFFNADGEIVNTSNNSVMIIDSEFTVTQLKKEDK